MPITSSNYLLYDWKNYAQMICMYFLVLNVIKNEDQQKFLVILISSVILLMALRNIRNFYAPELFSYSKRAHGPFYKVLLGANHFGAFIAYYSSLLFICKINFTGNPNRFQAKNPYNSIFSSLCPNRPGYFPLAIGQTP